MDLTPQQQAFVAEYVIDFNATRAAIVAGYSEKTARVQGSQLLNNTYVSKAIKEALEEHGTKREVLKQRVLNQLVNLSHSDIRDYVEYDQGGVTLKPSKSLTRAQAAAITEVREVRTQNGSTVTFKLSSKEKSLELLARHLGMLIDKTELSGGVKNEVSLDMGPWDLKTPGNDVD